MTQDYVIILTGIKLIKKGIIIYIEQKPLAEAFDIAMKCKKLLSISDNQIMFDSSSCSPKSMIEFYNTHTDYKEGFEVYTSDDFLNGEYKNYEKEDWA